MRRSDGYRGETILNQRFAANTKEITCLLALGLAFGCDHSPGHYVTGDSARLGGGKLKLLAITKNINGKLVSWDRNGRRFSYPRNSSLALYPAAFLEASGSIANGKTFTLKELGARVSGSYREAPEYTKDIPMMNQCSVLMQVDRSGHYSAGAEVPGEEAIVKQATIADGVVQAGGYAVLAGVDSGLARPAIDIGIDSSVSTLRFDLTTPSPKFTKGRQFITVTDPSGKEFTAAKDAFEKVFVELPTTGTYHVQATYIPVIERIWAGIPPSPGKGQASLPLPPHDSILADDATFICPDGSRSKLVSVGRISDGAQWDYSGKPLPPANPEDYKAWKKERAIYFNLENDLYWLTFEGTAKVDEVLDPWGERMPSGVKREGNRTRVLLVVPKSVTAADFVVKLEKSSKVVGRYSVTHEPSKHYVLLKRQDLPQVDRFYRIISKDGSVSRVANIATVEGNEASFAFELNSAKAVEVVDSTTTRLLIRKLLLHSSM